MNAEDAVIAAIDGLIDEQLERGEPFHGYPRCGSCGGDWHGLAHSTCRVGVDAKPEEAQDYPQEYSESEFLGGWIDLAQQPLPTVQQFPRPQPLAMGPNHLAVLAMLTARLAELAEVPQRFLLGIDPFYIDPFADIDPL